MRRAMANRVPVQSRKSTYRNVSSASHSCGHRLIAFVDYLFVMGRHSAAGNDSSKSSVHGGREWQQPRRRSCGPRRISQQYGEARESLPCCPRTLLGRMQLWKLGVTHMSQSPAFMQEPRRWGAQQWMWVLEAHMAAGKAAKVQRQPCLGQGGRLHDLSEVP